MANINQLIRRQSSREMVHRQVILFKKKSIRKNSNLKTQNLSSISSFQRMLKYDWRRLLWVIFIMEDGSITLEVASKCEQEAKVR